MFHLLDYIFWLYVVNWMGWSSMNTLGWQEHHTAIRMEKQLTLYYLNCFEMMIMHLRILYQ